MLRVILRNINDLGKLTLKVEKKEYKKLYKIIKACCLMDTELLFRMMKKFRKWTVVMVA